MSQRFHPSPQCPFLDPVTVSERVAFSLRAMGTAGQTWLTGLPGLLAGLAADWSITVGARLDGGRASYVAEATTHDGTPAVLKVSIPPGVGEFTPFDRQLLALRLADGDPYVGLIRHDVARRALLLKRLGRPMSALGWPVSRRLEALARTAARGWRLIRDPRPRVIQARGVQGCKLLLMVGLPGAGKTTRAKELAAAHRALRLTPDEWMISLFEGTQPDGKRDLLEGRLITLALQALQLGTNVVLDFGLWGRDERSALRWLATWAGASCRVIYLPVDTDVQRARIAHRQATAPHTTFPMTEADIDTWRGQFQVPDAAELRGGRTLPSPPPGWPGWPEWAADRWPSLDLRPAS